MSLDNILKRRALRLKKELSEGSGPAPSFLSNIYPATDHEGAMPHTVKTPSSIPSSNDAAAVTTADDREKGQDEKDEPGPSKTTSASLPVVPGESAMVSPDHKRAAFELGYFGEERSKQFIKNCVSIITGVRKLEQSEPTVAKGGGTAHGPKTCACGGSCDDCKKHEQGVSSPAKSKRDHSGLSALAQKFTKTKAKNSYG